MSIKAFCTGGVSSRRCQEEVEDPVDLICCVVALACQREEEEEEHRCLLLCDVGARQDEQLK
jgi:hypothetical protein